MNPATARIAKVNIESTILLCRAVRVGTAVTAVLCGAIDHYFSLSRMCVTLGSPLNGPREYITPTKCGGVRSGNRQGGVDGVYEFIVRARQGIVVAYESIVLPYHFFILFAYVVAIRGVIMLRRLAQRVYCRTQLSQITCLKDILMKQVIALLRTSIQFRFHLEDWVGMHLQGRSLCHG